MISVVLEFLKNAHIQYNERTEMMEVMGFSPDENYRTVLSGDPENIFDDLLSPAYSSILWNQKNLIIKYGGREYWLEKIGVNNLNEIAQEMTYVIDKADNLFTVTVAQNFMGSNSQCFLYLFDSTTNQVTFYDRFTSIDMFEKYCNTTLESKRPIFRIAFCQRHEMNQFLNRTRINPSLIEENIFSQASNFVFSKPFQGPELFRYLKQKENQAYLTILFEITATVNIGNLIESMNDPLDGPISEAKELFEYMKAVSSVPSYKIVARCFHVVQSSGSGKTKHGLELIKLCKQGLYFVKRKGDSSGFPPQPDWVREFLLLMSGANNLQCEFYWLALIYIALNQKFDQTTLGSFSDFFVESGKNFVISEFKKIIPEIIDESALYHITERITQKAANLRLTVESDKYSTQGSDIFFPIIIDEVAELLNCPNDNCIELFRSLRRALSKLKPIRGITTIMMGTKSAMKEFKPYSEDDSARAAIQLRSPEEKLFVPRPFVLSHNVDVFVRDIRVDFSEIERNPSVLHNDLIKFGRPLWNNYKSLPDAMNVAETKLKYFDPEIYPLNALILRACITVSPQGDLVHKMVQSGMATLLYVDTLGLKCFTTYIPEPVLSNAARKILQDPSVMKIALINLVAEMSYGILQKGQAGELVARIILLMAIDRNVPSETLVVYKRTSTFVADLTTEGVLSKEIAESFSIQFLNGFVSFSQFVNLETVGFEQGVFPFKVGPKLLLHAFIRGVALILPVGTKGADLIVPVLKSDNTMGCIIIQVKNLAEAEMISSDKSHCKTVVDKLEERYLDFLTLRQEQETTHRVFDCEYLPIVLQLTSDLESPLVRTAQEDSNYYWVEMARSRRSCLWLFGLGIFNHLIGDGNAPLLKDLLRGEFHFFDHVRDEPVEGNLTKSQNTQAGLLARLITSNPVSNKAFLAFADDEYMRQKPEETSLVQELIKDLGLTRRENRQSSISLAPRPGSVRQQQQPQPR